MPDAEGKQSFWTTIPGILTGIAALVTAITGLWIAVAPHDRPAEAQHPAAAPPVQSSAPGSAPPTSSQQSATATGASAAPAAARTSVVIASRAGDVTKLSAKTFIHNFTDKSIELTSGQTIPFEKIKTIDFLNVHADEHTVDVRVTLVDGRAVDGALRTNYAFNGESDLGPFQLFVQDVKQITFQ